MTEFLLSHKNPVPTTKAKKHIIHKITGPEAPLNSRLKNLNEMESLENISRTTTTENDEIAQRNYWYLYAWIDTFVPIMEAWGTQFPLTHNDFDQLALNVFARMCFVASSWISWATSAE